jgi:hypothetical protein
MSRMTIVCWVAAHALLAGCDAGSPATSAAEPDSLGATSVESSASPDRARDLYLELMKTSLLDLIYEADPKARAARKDGRDFPGRGMTMIGRERLDNLQMVAEDVLANNVPGDFIEAGAWRGGATIFMRAILAAYGVSDRKVWVADSFEGLPPPDPKNFPEDEGSIFHLMRILAVSLPNVQENFRRYDLLDNQVEFLKGWFEHTLPDAPIDRLAVLRIDADMYQSTTEALQFLYPKLSPGGWVIIDDYTCIPICAKAVGDYRAAHGIDAEIRKIDWCGVYWQKPRS